MIYEQYFIKENNFYKLSFFFGHDNEIIQFQNFFKRFIILTET